MSDWDAIDALKKTLPETPQQRRERVAQEALDAWRAWFKTAGAGWENVEDIEAELGRPSLAAASRDLARRGEPKRR